MADEDMVARRKLIVQTKRPWSYWTEDIGPAHWSEIFPAGCGHRQSPIDIIVGDATFDKNLGDGQFHFNYNAADCYAILNTGFSFQIQYSNGIEPNLTAVHLPDKYRLLQLHAHWGSNPHNGSEHLVGGVGYAGEIHIVHWNLKYQSLAEAAKHGDGLTVMGVFLNEVKDDNHNLDNIMAMLSQIQYKEDRVPLPNGFDVTKILPQNTSEFWTYEGSLTTPPLAETVLWTVFRNAIPISSAQLGRLRQLYAVDDEGEKSCEQRLLDNIRPPQPRHGRTVRASFKDGGV